MSRWGPKSLIAGLRGTHRAASLCSSPSSSILKPTLEAFTCSAQEWALPAAGKEHSWSQISCSENLLEKPLLLSKGNSWQERICMELHGRNYRKPTQSLQTPQHPAPNLMLVPQSTLKLNNPASHTQLCPWTPHAFFQPRPFSPARQMEENQAIPWSSFVRPDNVISTSPKLLQGECKW